MPRRRALLVGLAGCVQVELLLSACAGPIRSATGAVQVATVPPPVPTPTTAVVPTPARPTPAPAPTPTPTLVVPAQVALDVSVWNGSAQLQLDGSSIEPGQVHVARGAHQLAALVDGEVVAVADAPPDGGSVDLVVPPPLAGLAIMIENQADARPRPA